jgi:hypothetical protein
MIKHLISGLTLIFFVWLNGHSQSAMFTKAITTGSNNNETSKSILSDSHGNIYISGTFESTCHFGTDSVTLSGYDNMFLAKYNPNSGFLWAIAPSALYRVSGESSTFDNRGYLYVTGYFFGSVDFGNGYSFISNDNFQTYIAKYDSTGNLIWAKAVTGGSVNPDCIKGDKDGNIYLAGQFEGDLIYDSISLNSFNTAYFLLKMGTDGKAKWINYSTGSGTAYPKSIDIDPSGNILVTGTMINAVSFGTTNFEGTESYDVFICKVNAAGNFIWTIQAGGGGDDEASSVICGSDGSIFIDGTYEDVADFGSFALNTGNGYGSYAAYVAKIDGSGTFVWAQSIDVSSGENNTMTIDAQNNIFLTGSFWGSAEVGPSILWSNGYGDIYVIKIDKDGQVLWAKGAGSNYVDQGMGITLLPSGDLALTGMVSDGAVFDSITVSTIPGGMFIALLQQHGSIAIDEINYHSSDTLDTGDWIEIRNLSSKTIDLKGWTLKDGNDDHIFVIDTSTLLDPGNFLVFYQDTGKFRHFHRNLKNVVGPFIFDYASNSEKVRLFDTTGLLISQVRYYSTSSWPLLANGTGRTIELLSYQGELSDGNNWFNGCPGGSPGRIFQNCDSVGIATLPPKQSLFLYPDPVADFLTIEYFSTDNGSIDFLLFDAMGRKLKDEHVNNLKSGNNILKFTVNDLPPGLYLVMMTCNGNRQTARIMKK